ncbi:hypothetical protein Fot_33830 [Forsythia ovata]|uniref:DUF4210 domain-containing protein n=1 Tax=Forsythia ovata TaxID=205694 RepID=A0ABD1TCA8_9LAMI
MQVLLQVNVGVESVQDPVLEILQFEKCQERNLNLENQQNLTFLHQVPSGELLKWLLPLDNYIPPPARPSFPPKLGSSIRSTSSKPTATASSGSQLFSFGHFRSYSMSSLPPNSTPPPAATTPSAKPSFDPEDWNQFSFQKFVKSRKSGNEGLLSFRGMPLESERFSVQCGLEGIFTPGRRCRHAVAIVFEESSNDGPPLSLPIACVEAGDVHCLPNLALRLNVVKNILLFSYQQLHSGSVPRVMVIKLYNRQHLSAGSAASSLHYSSSIEGQQSGSPANHYAVLVSCRCNYTESKLFFKQPTSWRLRFSRDIMVSVASEMSRQAFGSDRTQLPVQVLTLQASNMTSEDLTFTVLSPPPVLSLSKKLLNRS